MDPMEGGTQPLAEPSAPLQDPAGQAAQVAAPAPAGQEPDAGSGQGEQQPAVDVEGLQKSYTEAQRKITAQAEELKAYKQALANPNMPTLPLPQAPQYDPNQYVPQYEPYPNAPADPNALQLRDPNELVFAALYERVQDLSVESRMPSVDEAMGFKLTPQDRESLMNFMRTRMPGTTDPVVAAQVLFHDRAIKAAEDRGRQGVTKEIKKAQAAALPQPAGQPGQTQPDMSGLDFVDAAYQSSMLALAAQKM